MAPEMIGHTAAGFVWLVGPLGFEPRTNMSPLL